MRSQEEIIQAFVQTDPTPKEFSVGTKEDPTFTAQVRQYRRERLALEVQLNIRDTLVALLKLAEQAQ